MIENYKAAAGDLGATVLKAAESLLNRVGAKAPEQVNHNVTAVHGVVLLPPKKEVVIDG